jgi:hypothetical protein
MLPMNVSAWLQHITYAKWQLESMNHPTLWEIHDYLTVKRKEIDQKYDYRYSVLLSVFARLMCEGWIREKDLEGLSGDKLKEIRRISEFLQEFETGKAESSVDCV